MWTCQPKQVTTKTQAGICKPGGLTITRTGRQPVSLIHQLSSLQQRPEQGRGSFYLYLTHTGGCAANSNTTSSLRFVWAKNRPPPLLLLLLLLLPSPESICLYSFIYQPACLACAFACERPQSVGLYFHVALSPTPPPISFSPPLSFCLSQNTVSSLPSHPSLCFLDS